MPQVDYSVIVGHFGANVFGVSGLVIKDVVIIWFYWPLFGLVLEDIHWNAYVFVRMRCFIVGN